MYAGNTLHDLPLQKEVGVLAIFVEDLYAKAIFYIYSVVVGVCWSSGTAFWRPFYIFLRTWVVLAVIWATPGPPGLIFKDFIAFWGTIWETRLLTLVTFFMKKRASKPCQI